jgi:hypothetical protein
MIDWQLLLEGKADGHSLPVNGARVGDPAASIQADRVQSHEWDPRVFVDQVCYVLADGRVQRIFIRGTPLEGLPFSSEKDIERTLGPSSGIERKLGWAIHHFPGRGISVGWHLKENRIEHVALGPVEWVRPTFGSKEVLTEWLAASRLAFSKDWKEPQERTGSAWVRFARITALLRAFDLGTPNSFREGLFLGGKLLEAYPRSAAAIEQYWGRFGSIGTRPDALQRLFYWLLVYRSTAEDLLQINSGWLEASHPGLMTAIMLTSEANKGVAVAMGEVEGLLRELISPVDRQISESEMVSRWGWPEIDIEHLRQEEL